MQNFLCLGFFDTTRVWPRLIGLEPQSWPGVSARGEVDKPEIGLGGSLLLRGHSPITQANWLEDLPVAELEQLQLWPEMQTLLLACGDRIMEEELGQRHLCGEMGRAMLSRLDPGSTIFWHQDDGPYHEANARFHLPLVTNPGCQLYSGPEVCHMPQGTLWYFNNRMRHSAGNFGPSYRVHLIFEMRKKP